jgi:putative ABC transport system permease protein
MAFRAGLLGEIVVMAFDTLRTNKMRSALTILGVVIGVTSIVGVTSLLRGFGNSIEALFMELGPRSVTVQKFGLVSFSSGKDFIEVMKRPNLTRADGDAIAALPSVGVVDTWLGATGNSASRMYYASQRTKRLGILGTTENFAAVSFVKMELGRLFTAYEVDHRKQVVVLGQTPYQSLFPSTDPIGKKVRIGQNEFTVIGVAGKRPSPGGFDVGADDYAIIPYTTHEKFYGRVVKARWTGSFNMSLMRSAMIVALPREGYTRDEMMTQIEEELRIRHNLRLDEPNDFDLVTQDVALKIWNQISQAIFLALVVISSIALMVGGIGVMAIMMISVTERTREIGVRKALGARRREILWQFLIEAGVLTSVGGLLGILFGSSIGLGIHWVTGFPVSLPWWSFAIGFGFSASIGIFFGLYPAIKASRLDPIEALRYE